jgi:hypothetical protein
MPPRTRWLRCLAITLGLALVGGLVRWHRRVPLTVSAVAGPPQPDGLTVVTIAVRNDGYLPRWIAPAQITLIDDSGTLYDNGHRLPRCIGAGQRVLVPIHVPLAPGRSIHACQIRACAAPATYSLVRVALSPAPPQGDQIHDQASYHARP